MLESADDFGRQLLQLPEELSREQAATNFINDVAAFMDEVQAGSTGTPGIFTYNKPPAIAAIVALPLVLDYSWVVPFANAIHSGTTTATLTPGTVTDPAWTATGVDTLTPTITNLPAALSLLISELPSVNWYNNPPYPLAQAIYDYTKSFTFECTGFVATDNGPVPLPLTFSAE